MAYKTGNVNADAAANTLVTGGSVVDQGAAIDMQGTDKGLLIPRLNTVDRDLLEAPPIVTYSDLVFAAGPDAYYQQDELSYPTPAIDTMGLIDGVFSGITVPLLGSSPLKSGDPKTSVQYTTAQGHILITPPPGSILSTAGDISVETIFRTFTGGPVSQYRPLVYKGTNTVVEYAVTSWIDGGLHRIFFENDNGTNLFTSDFTPNLIRHVVVTMTATGDVEIWVDGVLIGTVSASTRLGSDTGIFIGYRPKSPIEANGDISDTAFYSRILTPVEILQRANKALV